MSFLKAATSFTRFRVTDEIPAGFWQEFPEKLKQFAFKEIEESAEERGFGWVCFDDMLDSFWRTAPPEKGEYMTFSLRLDTRRIPAAVVKKHVTLKIREEERKIKEQGKKFVSRERKKELKEQVMLQIRAHTYPIPAEFNVVWNTRDNILYLGSTQGKVLDLFMDYFTHSFNLHLEPLTPYALAVHHLGDDVMEQLDYVEPTQFA